MCEYNYAYQWERVSPSGEYYKIYQRERVCVIKKIYQWENVLSKQNLSAGACVKYKQIYQRECVLSKRKSTVVHHFM